LRPKHFFDELNIAGFRQRRHQAARYASELTGLREVNEENAFHVPNFISERCRAILRRPPPLQRITCEGPGVIGFFLRVY
jgi:hypothetical protein